MKKIFAITILFIFFIYLLQKKLTENKKIITYQLNGKKYQLLKAITPQEWQKGLMFYKSKKELKGADGMIFIFPDNQVRSFWNINTYLDLDVYWLNDDNIVGKSYLPSIEKSKKIIIISSPKKVNKVVELVL